MSGPLTREQKAEIVRLASSPRSARDIAREYGVEHGAVIRVWEQAFGRTTQGFRRRKTDSAIEEVGRLASLEVLLLQSIEIADSLAVDPSTREKYLLRKLGGVLKYTQERKQMLEAAWRTEE